MAVLEDNLVELDGSYGEGGGQILRTALSLSAILRNPFTISHLRSKRKNPGLQAQHLEAVKAMAQMTNAQTEGVEFGSQRVSFFPQKILPGNYQFEVKTAGSTLLLFQAMFLPLLMAKSLSHITLIGGTHVPWSPPFHYFSEVLLPHLELMGISIEPDIKKWGFYPRGGGKIQFRIHPIDALKPIHLTERGACKRIRGLSVISHLPKHVAERQRDQAMKRIRKELKMESEIHLLYDVPSNGPGSFLFLLAEYEKTVAGFSSLGQKGKPAEKVSDETVDALKEYMEGEGCIDPHLADQLVLFMAFAKGNSSLTTTRMTQHLLTNLWVINHFMPVRIEQQGELEKPGRIKFINE
ncbi:MAG: RNA 3'-phosphate cyclase [Syntrophaceae bacterium]|nr:RNA 3'-phosphate cyclase [Syntrophaceae bacterium]